MPEPPTPKTTTPTNYTLWVGLNDGNEIAFNNVTSQEILGNVESLAIKRGELLIGAVKGWRYFKIE